MLRMEKSTTVVVQKNAPGWPAMVQKEKKVGSKKSAAYERMKAESSRVAAASIFSHNNISSSSSEKGPDSDINTMCRSFRKPRKYNVGDNQEPVFAPKPRLMRQCEKCQLLYTSFHTCSSVIT